MVMDMIKIIKMMMNIKYNDNVACNISTTNKGINGNIKNKMNIKYNDNVACNISTTNKIARPQESQSFTAYTISKEQYDS